MHCSTLTLKHHVERISYTSLILSSRFYVVLFSPTQSFPCHNSWVVYGPPPLSPPLFLLQTSQLIPHHHRPPHPPDASHSSPASSRSPPAPTSPAAALRQAGPLLSWFMVRTECMCWEELRCSSFCTLAFGEYFP